MGKKKTSRPTAAQNTVVPSPDDTDDRVVVWTGENLRVLFEEVKRFKQQNPDKNISWKKIAEQGSLVDACNFALTNTICRSAWNRYQSNLNDPNSNDSIRFNALSTVSSTQDNEETTQS